MLESLHMGLKADFCIEIDFKKESEAPSRVFRTMSDLLDALQAFDRDLIQSIDTKIEPVVLLEDIEAGSIRAWLKYLLSGIDDEALKKMDWKPAVGKYLVQAKYSVIRFLEGKTEITDRPQMEALNKELLELAEETDIKHIPAYSPLPNRKLIENLLRITTATGNLLPGDGVKYITHDSEALFNLGFKVVPESIEDLLTKEIIKSDLEMIFKVKKPDYLGESKWELKHENRTIPVKIADTDWLDDFQNRKIDIRPGDSLRAMVHLETKYGYDLDVISINHTITKVIEVIPFNPSEESHLFE